MNSLEQCMLKVRIGHLAAKGSLCAPYAKQVGCPNPDDREAIVEFCRSSVTPQQWEEYHIPSRSSAVIDQAFLIHMACQSFRPILIPMGRRAYLVVVDSYERWYVAYKRYEWLCEYFKVKVSRRHLWWVCSPIALTAGPIDVAPAFRQHFIIVGKFRFINEFVVDEDYSWMEGAIVVELGTSVCRKTGLFPRNIHVCYDGQKWYNHRGDCFGTTDTFVECVAKHQLCRIIHN